MTLTEILANEELRQHEFPVAKNKIFLGHAGVCPLPRRVAQAMIDCATGGTLGDQETFVMQQLTAARRAGAQLLNSQPDEISLVGPTSLALSFVAAGLNFRKGDNILIYHDDYPSNVYPWMALAEKGVKVRLMNIRHLGAIRKVDIMGQVDEDTKLVALASNHFISGHRLEHDAIGQFLRERNILFCLDAIQTLGAFPTTVENVDFLAADSHKWLLGPLAAGIVYVAKERFEECRPTLLGSWNIKSPDFLAQKTIEFEEGGRRYEPGVLNVAGIYGMRASINLIREQGIDSVSSLILQRRDQLETGLASLGFDFLSPRSSEPLRSGILTTRHPGKDPSKLIADLEKAFISASYRKTRDHGFWLRFSPHFYNTSAEIDRVLDVLSEAVKS